MLYATSTCIGTLRCGKKLLHFRGLTQSGRCPLFLFLGTKMDATIRRVWELAAPLAKAEGMEIVDIELHHEGTRGGRILRLYLDKEGGPGIDDLGRVSRQLSDLLDSDDVVPKTELEKFREQAQNVE